MAGFEAAADKQMGSPNESPQPRWYRSFWVQFLIADAPLGLAIIGILTRNKWLVWSGLLGFGVWLAAGIAYALVFGVYVPIHTIRKWKELPVLGKVVLAAASLLIIILLGGIIVAWIVTRRSS